MKSTSNRATFRTSLRLKLTEVSSYLSLVKFSGPFTLTSGTLGKELVFQTSTVSTKTQKLTFLFASLCSLPAVTLPRQPLSSKTSSEKLLKFAMRTSKQSTWPSCKSSRPKEVASQRRTSATLPRWARSPRRCLRRSFHASTNLQTLETWNFANAKLSACSGLFDTFSTSLVCYYSNLYTRHRERRGFSRSQS